MLAHLSLSGRRVAPVVSDGPLAPTPPGAGPSPARLASEPSSVVTLTYTYDPLYRLTNATFGSNGDVFTYTYDAVGNRLTQTTLTATTVYTYDDANRLINVNGVNYTWDNNGNLTGDGASTYAYDSANRLKTLTQGANTYTFGYNGLGDRLQQTINGNTTTYVLDLNAGLTQVLADGSNTYLYGNGRIAQYAGSTPAYFLSDALGSVRQLTNASGQVTLARSYDPFGNPLTSVGSGTTSYNFAGEWRDNTGLLHLRARYYGPQWGRFLTADTWAGDYNRPLLLNRWNYVNGNPVNHTDPSGHCFEPATATLCVLGVTVLIGVVYIGVMVYAHPEAFHHAVEDVVGICERLLAPPITQPNERVGTNPFTLPYEYRAPQPRGTVVPPLPLPQATATNEPPIEYFHLTTAEDAEDILSNGIRPEKGARSEYDRRFFAWTLAPRYSPPTTLIQLMEMMDDLRSQLDVDFPNAHLVVVHVLLPERVVTSLERSRQLHYGPYLTVSTPGYQESIFEVSSFPTVNQYRSFWYPTDYR